MSVRRTIADAPVLQAEARDAEGAVWPRRFVDHTPTLGWTPTLPDETAFELAATARRAAATTFGSRPLASPADAPTPT